MGLSKPTMPQSILKKKAGISKKKSQLKFTIDCTHPVDDHIFDVTVFEEYLSKKIKVGGKPGAFGDAVVLNRDKNSCLRGMRVVIVLLFLPWPRRIRIRACQTT